MWGARHVRGGAHAGDGLHGGGREGGGFGGIVRLLDTRSPSPLLVFDFTGWRRCCRLLAALT